MQDPRLDPECSGVKLIERRRYEWRGSEGYVEAYIYIKGGKHFKIFNHAITHPEGSTNSLTPGWQQPEPMDYHRYATAMAAPLLGPPPP